MSLLFGNSGDLVNHSSAAALDNLADFTAWAWVYRTADGTNQLIMSKNGALSAGWLLLLITESGEGTFRFIRYRSTTNTDIRSAGGVIPLNTWTFCAVTSSLTTKLYTSSLSGNVAEVSYSLQQEGAGSIVSDASSDLYVGNVQIATSLPFKGRIARGGLVDRVLSFSELSALRRESLVGANVSGTKLLFDYTTAADSQTDYSVNGNTGTRTGAVLANHPPFFAITTPSLPNGAVGTPYSQTLALANQIDPLQLAEISNGSLPGGLSIGFTGAANTPIITGNPTSSGAFRVRLVDDEGNVAEKYFSITITGGSGDTQSPTVPGGLTATVVSSSQINLAWNASTDNVGVTGYDVQRATNSGFTENLVTTNLGNVTAYNNTGLAANTLYYYRVRAHDGVPNNSAYSVSISRTTLPMFAGTKTFSGGYAGMCADNDTLHIITGIAPDTITYYRSPDEGATWDIDGVAIGNGITYPEEPLVANGAGKIAVFYFKNLKDIRDFFTPPPNTAPRRVGELFCKVSLDGGTSWQSERLVSGVVVPGEGYRMSACWNGNSLHVNWMDFKNVPNEVENDPVNQTKSWDIYYNRCVDVTNNLNFEGEQNLVPCEIGNQTGQVRPSISKLGNTIHSVWFAGIPGKGSCTIDTGTTNLPQCSEIFYQRNPNNGAAGSWETKIQLTNNTNPIRYSGRNTSRAIPGGLLIGFDRGGVGGGATNDIYGIRTINNGNSFEAEFPIVTDPNSQTHSAIAEKNSIAHIVWGDYGNDGAIFYKQSTNNAASFGITENTFLGGTLPFIAATANYVHVLCAAGGVAAHKRRFLPPLPPPDIIPPTVPGVPLLNLLNSRIDLTWAASFDDESGIVGYDVQRSTSADFSADLQTFPVGNITSYSDTTAINGILYYYHVRARDGAGNPSAYSGSASGQAGIPFPYPLVQTNLELFLEAQTQTQTTGQSVSSFNDLSGNNRHLIASSNQPTVAVSGGFKEIRIQRTNNVLKHVGYFVVKCGWILAKINGNFLSYDGLLTDLIDLGILVGKPSSSVFSDVADFGFEFWDFRLNDKIYPKENAPAPIDQFKLIFFNSYVRSGVNGIQIGKDRNNSGRDLDGSVRMVALYSEGFNSEEEIRAQSEVIANFYGLTLADVYPYQADIKGASENPAHSVNFYDPPEGARISESLDDSRRIIELKFSAADQKEVKAVKKLYADHYAQAAPFIYRDYRFTPPEDIEGYLDSLYELEGENNDWIYSFKIREK